MIAFCEAKQTVQKPVCFRDWKSAKTQSQGLGARKSAQGLHDKEGKKATRVDGKHWVREQQCPSVGAAGVAGRGQTLHERAKPETMFQPALGGGFEK